MASENTPVLRDTRFPFPENIEATASVRPLGTSVRSEIKKLIDVSATGIRFLSGKRFNDGADLDLLILHHGYKLKCIVSVKRVNAEGDLFDVFAGFETVSQKNLDTLFSMVQK